MLDIYIPTFGRHERLEGIGKQIDEVTPLPHQVHFIIEIEDKDSFYALENTPYDIVLNRRKKNYAGAINSAWDELHSELFFAGADDLTFYSGWYEAAIPKLEQFAVVGTNDKHNQEVTNGEHATHYFIKGAYIEEHGGTFDGSAPVLPEVYDHNWTDREFIGTAKFRGVFTPCVESVVEHLHFTYGLSPLDDTYRKTRLHVDADEVIYEQRRNNWGRL